MDVIGYTSACGECLAPGWTASEMYCHKLGMHLPHAAAWVVCNRKPGVWAEDPVHDVGCPADRS